MCIVKVQRPLAIGNSNVPWLVYDQFRARECVLFQNEVPRPILQAFSPQGNSIGQIKAFFKNAEWDQKSKCWDLSKVVRISDRNW